MTAGGSAMGNRPRWDSAAVVGVGVLCTLAVQASTRSLWWTVAYGLPIAVMDGVALATFAAGSLVQRARSTDRTIHTIWHAAAGSLAVAAAALAVRAATTPTTQEIRRPWLDLRRCGSPLYPENYDCAPMPGSWATVWWALVAVGLGGWCFAAARDAERGPRLAVPRWLAWAVVAIGVASSARAGQLVPRRRGGAAPGLEVLGHDLRLSALWLLGAVAAFGLGASVLRRPQSKLPLMAVVPGVLSAAAGGLAVSVIWMSVLVDYLKGP